MKVSIPVFDNLPPRLSRLGELSYNIWWSWTTDARDLFRRLDRSLWRNSRHNPVLMLQQLSPEALEARATDVDFVASYDELMRRFDRYMGTENTWYVDSFPDFSGERIAYFCAEFGLHNSLPIYSGGLGLLAGDTCKEASDLGLPFVGIGYFYPEGYFRQRLGADGRQSAEYVSLDTETAPVLPVLNDDGSRFLLSVPVGAREIKVSVWKVQVGRVPIFLMDTCVEENAPWDRDLSARLYGGDHSVRLRQEIILGMGGLRVLKALGWDPTLLHLNEGHAAFAALELLSSLKDRGLSFEEALAEARRQIAFTTHTPVGAGHDQFSFQMMEESFRWLWEKLEISRERFLEIGRVPGDHSFGLTVLALRTSGRANGVSQVHGRVSREMWHSLWSERAVDDVPIAATTNGVHVPTWVPVEMARLFRKYLGEDWMSRHDDQTLWDRIDQIPDEELWKTHLSLKRRLMRLARGKARSRWVEGEVTAGQIVAQGSLLDPDALTIGFARRYATYKRGGLIFRDMARLQRIVTDRWRPVQFVLAGKAHPDDEPGKFVLQEAYRSCMSPELQGRVAFIEEYNMHVGHLLVQGVDVWLNNPIPPLEASGTSGQKSSLNGVPNCSVLDGWWHEGYNGNNGWGIDAETGLSDDATAAAIYDLLENRIVPLYYERDREDIPRHWVALMKETIRSLAAPFSARRMMKEYFRKAYEPLLRSKIEAGVR